MNGEEVGGRRGHVDLVVVCLSGEGGTYQFLDARRCLAGPVVSLEVLGLVIEKLQIAVVNNVIEFAVANHHIDGLGLEEVEGFAVPTVLLLLHPQDY